MNLLAQQHKKRELTPQQSMFLENLFENGGNVTEAALAAVEAELADNAQAQSDGEDAVEGDTELGVGEPESNRDPENLN